MKLEYVLSLVVSALYVVEGQIVSLDEIPRAPFDQELYESVLDPQLCEQQIQYMVWLDQLLLLEFLDTGFRIPSGLFGGNTQHFGNYFECLKIHDEILGNPIQGKYCMMKVPADQTFRFPFPFLGEFNGRQMLESELRRSGRDLDVDNILDGLDLSDLEFRFGLCIPQACTTQEWVTYMFTNVSIIGFHYEEEYCRLPNDKPWVTGDYIAIGIFSAIAILTILSTCYDLHYTFTLKKDPKQISPLYSCFSVYTNTRRLTTFTQSSNALDCLDGIRSLSMIWVIIGHAFSMYSFISNILELIDFMVTIPSSLVSTGVFAVDTFILMTGLLLVYTSVGKMKSKQLLGGLHMFYIHRILRLFPLLATIVLLEATFFHKIGDGPFWMNVARNTERCRDWWWSTLLYVQNYVNIDTICVEHSWYLAIDMQLHIISPIVLYWVLSGKKNIAWSALLGGLLVSLTAATIFNFMMDMPSTHSAVPRFDEMDYYMQYYYKNTLTRASPFFYGMMVGYILNINKGRKVKLHRLVVILFWIIGLGMFTSVFWMQYAIMQMDYSNQLGDNLYNSFSRTAWSLGLSWLIFACVHGYGGPINWFLSLPMWKLPSRISYAMYLFHYPFMFVVVGLQVAPVNWSPERSLFESIAFFTLSFLVCFALTVFIDAPFSTLTKLAMGGGPKRRPREVEENRNRNKANPEESPENVKEVKSDDRNNA